MISLGLQSSPLFLAGCQASPPLGTKLAPVRQYSRVLGLYMGSRFYYYCTLSTLRYSYVEVLFTSCPDWTVPSVKVRPPQIGGCFCQIRHGIAPEPQPMVLGLLTPKIMTNEEKEPGLSLYQADPESLSYLMRHGLFMTKSLLTMLFRLQPATTTHVLRF